MSLKRRPRQRPAEDLLPAEAGQLGQAADVGVGELGRGEAGFLADAGKVQAKQGGDVGRVAGAEEGGEVAADDEASRERMLSWLGVVTMRMPPGRRSRKNSRKTKRGFSRCSMTSMETMVVKDWFGREPAR